MRLLSVSLGRARQVEHQGGLLETGIFKEPVDSTVRVFAHALEGDTQVDLRYHGGADKAVYVYPAEHYGHWCDVLQRDDLVHGQFGENFTSVGLLETDICLGDRLSIGTALFEVTQPRVPCFKLGLRMGDASFVKQFHNSRRVGFYLRVLQEGEVRGGDAIEIVHRDPERITIDAVYALRFGDNSDQDALRRVLRVGGLSQAWREEISARLKPVS